MNAQDIREFMNSYFTDVAADFEGALEKYVADQKLLEHGDFFQSAFPGYRIEPLETVAEDNKFAVFAMFHGTHQGPLMDIEPTGKEVSVPFMIIYYVEDEKIVDHRIVLNELSMMQQLGVVPAAAPA